MRLGVVYDVCYVSRRCSNARKNPCCFGCLSSSQDTGVFFYGSNLQKTAVALGLDPQTTTAIYPLSINTRCENRIFAAPRTSSHGSGARGAALLLPLSMPILTVSNLGQVLRGYMSRIGEMCGQSPPPTRRLPAAYGAPALRSLWCCTGFVLCPSACSRGGSELEGSEAKRDTSRNGAGGGNGPNILPPP